MHSSDNLFVLSFKLSRRVNIKPFFSNETIGCIVVSAFSNMTTAKFLDSKPQHSKERNPD